MPNHRVLPDLSARLRSPELMDDPALDRGEHRRALDALGRAHLVCRTAAPIWSAIRELASSAPPRRLRVAELACGGGHVSVALARLAARHGIEAEFVGSDISPVAVDYAAALARRTGVRGVRFVRADALRDHVGETFDVALSSLFLHHLNDDEAVAGLAAMKRLGRRLVVVSDLKRSRLGYCVAWAGCRLLSRSRVFRTDGALSVRAAYSPGEIRAIAQRAGLTGATVASRWPQRFVLTWKAGSGCGDALEK
jgi:SAM-dependent methyltransferase